VIITGYDHSGRIEGTPRVTLTVIDPQKIQDMQKAQLLGMTYPAYLKSLEPKPEEE